MAVVAWWVLLFGVGSAAGGLWRLADLVAARERGGALGATERRSSRLAGWLEPRLASAGVSAAPGEVLQLAGAVTTATAIVAASVDGRLVGVVVVGACIAPPCWLRYRRRRHSAAIARALPDALRVVAAELRVGGTVVSGLATLGDSANAVGKGAAGVCRRTELGADLDTALVRWAEELGTSGARAMAGALALAAHVGGPAAAALDGLASSLGERFDAQAELQAQSAQARASALVMVFAPFGYLLFAATMDQQGLDVLLGSTLGRLCLTVGVMLDGLAWCWIRVLLRDRFAL